MSQHSNDVCEPLATARRNYAQGARRAGLTLVEMMVAIAIMTIMAGAVGSLSVAIQQANDYSNGRSTALQHARVSVERINRMVTTAYAAPTHPGVAVYVTTWGTNRYPDTLLVWQPPNGVPTNPLGPPLISEVTFYCFDPTTPANLLELTAPGDTRTIPFDSTLQTTAWGTALDALKRANTSQKTTLTTLLRQFTATGSGAQPAGFSATRGAARFELTLAPLASEYSAYLGGSSTWANMSWPVGLYSSQFGLRRVWVRTELQLMPANRAGQQDTTGGLVLPFFSSAAFSYTMTP